MQNEADLRDFPHFFDRFTNDLFQQEDRPAMDDEPLYVNAKQYFRILKRRVARTRLEELHRLSRQRKPYLHESRHKHAMRRPRGPGGRFLTADEIAAQKSSASEDHIMDEDLTLNSPDTDPEQPQNNPSAFLQQPLVNIDFPRHHIPIAQSIPSTSQSSPVQRLPSPPMYSPPPQHQSLPPQQPHHHHHSASKGTMNPAPITLSSPYPGQMHHVPHPHAHARHHHSNFATTYTSIFAPDPLSQSSIEMQRRTEEMIQFGGTNASTT